MVIGIGCDIVEHKTTELLKWDFDNNLLHRIFSPQEIEFCNNQNKISFLAGRFAAKEAVLKCLGTGMQDGISLSDIQILQLETGKPTVALTGKVKEISDNMKIDFWLVSITHSTNYSLAFVIAELQF